MFLVLGQSGMFPLASLYSSFVFVGSEVDGASGFTNIDCFRIAAAVKPVNAFAFTWRRTSFVFGTEDVLQFLATFMVQVTPCPLEGSFERLGDARYERQRSVWAESRVVIDRLRMEWKFGEEVRLLLLLLTLRLLLL